MTEKIRTNPEEVHRCVRVFGCCLMNVDFSTELVALAHLYTLLSISRCFAPDRSRSTHRSASLRDSLSQLATILPRCAPQGKLLGD